MRAVVGEEWGACGCEAVLGWAEEPLLQALDDALAAKVILPATSEPSATGSPT